MRKKTGFPFIAQLSLHLIAISGLVAQQSIYTPPEKNNCPRSLKQAHRWYFGEGAGMDFISDTARVLLDQNVMTAYKSSAIINDSSGNLLFFTNGRKVWDRAFNLMPGATELYGDVGVTQPCIIVPQPGPDSLFYLFTVDVLAFMPDNSYTTRGINYTIIDMKARGGMGDAGSYINVPLLSPACQKITGVGHANGTDFWVIAHKWDSDEFYAWPVGRWGIGDPVISPAGSVHGGGYSQQMNAIGYMKASPNGQYIALAVTGTDQIELFTFNNTTGEVSNPASYSTAIPGIDPYGIEFSPDNRMLYATLIQVTGNGPPSRPSCLLQFDLSSGLISPSLIDSVPGIRLGAMQLAPDGRIYVSRTVNLLNKRDSLDVIYNPTRPGIACNFNRLDNVPQSRFSLEGRNGIYSLPNVIQSYLDIPVFTYDSCCFQDGTTFRISNRANIDQVLWNFGDGTTSAVSEPVHVFAQPGTYSVSLTESWNEETFTDTLPVTIHDLPSILLGDTIMLYSGAVINLHAGGGLQTYLWSTGSTDSIISTESQGDYRVEVQDWNCCFNTDSVYVKVFQYFIPNTFTPNGDGLNDIFRVVGLYRDIEFKMYVYDRWGGLVFTSSDIDQGWDGTFKGKPADADTYIWIVHVNFLGEDIITNGDVVLKGTVTILK